MINTDSFSKIWSGLTNEQRYSLCTSLLHEKCTTTRQTVWNWANGYSRPTSHENRKHIADVVRKVVGLHVLPDTLFPPRNGRRA